MPCGQVVLFFALLHWHRTWHGNFAALVVEYGSLAAY
jgi:hypothetical protein